MLNRIVSGMLLILAIIVMGCESENPVTMDPSMAFGEIKNGEAASTAEDNLKIVRTIPATIGGAANAPSLITQEESNEFEIDTDVQIKDEDEVVHITIDVDEGVFVYGHVVKLYHNSDDGEEWIGRVKIAKYSYLSSITISVEFDDILTDEEITLQVKIEFDGEIVANEETEEFIVVTYAEIEDEETSVVGNKVTVTFDERVEIDDRDARNNLTLTRGDDEVEIHNVDMGYKGNLVVETEDSLTAGQYTLTYNGEEGIYLNTGANVAPFTVEFEIKEKQPEYPVWKTVPTGLYESAEIMIVALRVFGFKTTDWTLQVLRGPDFEVESDQNMVSLYLLTATDLGLTGPCSVNQVVEAATELGFTLVPAETAVQTRLLYGNQPEGEMLMVMSELLRKADESQVGKKYLLTLDNGYLGDDGTITPGRWLGAHRFADGASLITAGHKFILGR